MIPATGAGVPVKGVGTTAKSRRDSRFSQTTPPLAGRPGLSLRIVLAITLHPKKGTAKGVTLSYRGSAPPPSPVFHGTRLGCHTLARNAEFCRIRNYLGRRRS